MATNWILSIGISALAVIGWFLVQQRINRAPKPKPKKGLPNYKGTPPPPRKPRAGPPGAMRPINDRLPRFENPPPPPPIRPKRPIYE